MIQHLHPGVALPAYPALVPLAAALKGHLAASWLLLFWF